MIKLVNKTENYQMSVGDVVRVKYEDVDDVCLVSKNPRTNLVSTIILKKGTLGIQPRTLEELRKFYSKKWEVTYLGRFEEVEND